MLKIVEKNELLVVDSRLVAGELEIQHKTLVETIRKYETEIESTFGQLTVETEVVKGHNGGGNPQTFYYLTEDQATFVMTLSRNTNAVVRCKAKLVKAFSDAKRLIEVKLPDITSAEYLLIIAQNMVEKERRLKKLEQEQQEIKNELDTYVEMAKEATETINILPKSEIPALKTSDRLAISQLVRSWAVKNSVDFKDVWNKLYLELKYRYSFDVAARARNSGKPKLDIVEEAGLIQQLYAIATDVLL